MLSSKFKRTKGYLNWFFVLAGIASILSFVMMLLNTEILTVTLTIVLLMLIIVLLSIRKTVSIKAMEICKIGFILNDVIKTFTEIVNNEHKKSIQLDPQKTPIFGETKEELKKLMKNDNVGYCYCNIEKIENLLTKVEETGLINKSKNYEVFENLKKMIVEIKKELKNVDEMENTITRLKDETEILVAMLEMVQAGYEALDNPLEILNQKLYKILRNEFYTVILSNYESECSFEIIDLAARKPKPENKKCRNTMHSKQEYKIIDSLKEKIEKKETFGSFEEANFPWKNSTNLIMPEYFLYHLSGESDGEQRYCLIFFSKEEDKKIIQKNEMHIKKLFSHLNKIIDIKNSNFTDIFDLEKFSNHERAQYEISVFTNDLYYDIIGLHEVVEMNLKEQKTYNYLIARDDKIVYQMIDLIKKWKKSIGKFNVFIFFISDYAYLPSVSELAVYNLREDEKKEISAFMMFPAHALTISKNFPSKNNKEFSNEDFIEEDFAVKTKGKLRDTIINFFQKEIKGASTKKMKYHWQEFLSEFDKDKGV